MIYRVRTRSGKDYLTMAEEPAEAMNSRSDWRTITFSTLENGRTVIIRGNALESVEIIPEEEIPHR